jgi:hypothetical protein
MVGNFIGDKIEERGSWFIGKFVALQLLKYYSLWEFLFIFSLGFVLDFCTFLSEKIFLSIMNELIDLTDKLAKKHGPLTQHSSMGIQNGGKQLDYFYIFFLVFSGLVLLAEPIFVLVFANYLQK